MKFTLLLVTLLFQFAPELRAWSGPGHMTVAAIAYRDLAPKERQQITAILAQHPEYGNWQEAAAKDDIQSDQGMVAVMGASTWPDLIKRSGSPWNHQKWHYVDYPLEPPDFPIKPAPSPEEDIVFAINLALKSLKDLATTPSDKACWLSWLIHLMGDIHQPLYCCALITPELPAPDGDKGGNLLFVKARESTTPIPLHQMWDNALGTASGFHDKQVRKFLNQAIRLESKLKRAEAPEIKQHRTTEEWARESCQIALEKVYLKGALPYGKNVFHAAVVPEGYTKELNAIAENRVTIAGYRLADLLRAVVR